MQDDRKARILAQVDLPSLLLSHGVELQKEGAGYRAKCINHDDSNPSMQVYTKSGDHHCHCYACGYHADTIGVYMTLTGCGFPQALDDLAGERYEGNKFAAIKDAKPIVKPERKVFPPPPGTADPIWSKANRRKGEEWVSMGEPTDVWRYSTLEGETWYYEARYEYVTDDGEIKKEPRCWTWGKRGEQPARWELGFPPDPRPLYGLEGLATATQALVFEGPKKAAHARKLLNGNNVVACVAWPGGAKAAHKADWTVLDGLDVVLIPDSDEPGYQAIDRIAGIIKPKTLHYVDVADMPHAWDIADAKDWTKQDLLAFLRERKNPYTEKLIQEPAKPEPVAEEPPPHTEPPPIEAYIKETAMDWPEPLDVFTDVLAPRIKRHQMPPAFADWIEDISGVIGVDPAMITMPAIVAAASMLDDRIQLQPEINNPGWRESARLWTAICADASSKKSPAISKVLGIVKKIDAECHEDEGKLRYAYSLKEKAHKQAESAYVDALSKGEEPPLPVKPELPEIPRAIAQDCTVEALRDILKHSHRGILAEKDELSGFFAFDQYKSKGGDGRQNWLELYNGNSRRVDRVGSGSVFIKNWSACLIGGIQTEPLKAIASNLQEDGLLQRFMVIYGRPGKPGNEQPPNKAYDDRYRTIMRQLWETKSSGETVKLSPQANEIRKEIITYAYKLIDMGFISGSMCSHLGKYEGLSARLMLAMHGIDCADRHIHPESIPVSAQTAQCVKSLMLEFLLPHSIQFYMDILSSSTNGKIFSAIARLIISSHPNEFSLRDLDRGYIGWRTASEPAKEHVLNRLIDSGWIAPAPTARVASGRRVVSRYMVNPSLKDKFAAIAEAERVRRDEYIETIARIRAEHGED
jgi:hypothetical protein